MDKFDRQVKHLFKKVYFEYSRNLYSKGQGKTNGNS